MMKRLVCVLVVLGVLLFNCVPAVFAASEGNWEYSEKNGEIGLTRYNGSGGDVVIPDRINGKPVTRVSASLRQATSVTFPSGVQTVEAIFGETATLRSVSFAEGVETISKGAFTNCKNLSDLTLPSTLKKIKNDAFSGCAALERVYLPNGLTELADAAFADCTSLKEVALPNQLQRIGSRAFQNCTSLSDAELPQKLQEIGSKAFMGCVSLTDPVFPDQLKKIEAHAFAESGIKELNLEWLNCEIGSSAFKGCKSLTKAILPIKLTTVAYALFADTPLEAIYLPSGVTEISDNAFSGCDRLKEIVIPYGVNKIGINVFQNCSSLNAIYLPDSAGSSFDMKQLTSGAKATCMVYCAPGNQIVSACKKDGIPYTEDKSVNSKINVFYNGSRISFHAYDQNPEVINDRTMVPLRSIFEAMHASVVWDEATSTATSTRGNITVKIRIGSDTMYKNDQAIPVDVPAMVRNDRTLIPVRVIAEAFGANVEWIESANTVLITE